MDCEFRKLELDEQKKNNKNSNDIIERKSLRIISTSSTLRHKRLYHA